MDYTLTNGSRELQLTGEQIAHSTSRGNTVDLDALRWTEVDVYRTEAGSYVLHKLGRSRVYHELPGCSRRAIQSPVRTFTRKQEQALVPCPRCWSESPFRELGEVWVEQDKGTASVSKTAAGLIESAYSEDSDGVRFITRTAERAIELAAAADDAVAAAWQVERVA